MTIGEAYMDGADTSNPLKAELHVLLKRVKLCQTKGIQNLIIKGDS